MAADRMSLTSFLDYQRATLELRCQGLTSNQLKQRAVPTSKLTLLSLLRHAAEVETSWFRFVLNQEHLTPRGPAAEGISGEFLVADADVDEAFKLWRGACESSRAVTDSFESLDDTVAFRGETISLRYVLTHMVEEYARHNGHADLLQEAIDSITASHRRDRRRVERAQGPVCGAPQIRSEAERDDHTASCWQSQ
ncbi:MULTISPECIES: DinB family protein [unclassified Streptomyces]|uniref:DinB family protein n=1 Tax=unclassified Streptomyces TaxID=2593676 RepID=UPI002E133874|nr:DinB family protein [Streptomyces sp. NBC_01197]WSS53294.1 DinB family protein [Streptomyces sp. NBC_01180]